MESGNKINNNQTMTVKRLHWILSAAIKDGHGDLPVKFSVSEEPDDGDIVESIYNVSDWRLVTGKEGTLFLETTISGEDNGKKIDDEQVEFIEGLLADESKTWEERLDEIIAWRKKNRGLLGIHVSIMPPKDGAPFDPEKFAEELCRIALEAAKGELKEVDISKEEL